MSPLENKAILADLISNSKLSKVELRKNLYSYFNRTKEFDIVLMKNKIENILDRRLEKIDDATVNRLIAFLSGEEIQQQEKAIEVKQNDLMILQGICNEQMVTIQKLLRRIEELEKGKD